MGNLMNDMKLPDELQRYIDEFKAWDDHERQRYEKAVDKPLHHYTDMPGFVGMLEGGKLWLTSIFHMNDPSELSHGVEIALSRLHHHLEKNESVNVLATTPLVLDSFCQRMQDVLLNDVADAFGFFVGSFSRAGDDLGQWRSYADDARGVAIEISPEWFQPSDSTKELPIEERYVVAEVVYDEVVARERQFAPIDRAVEIVKEVAPTLAKDRAIRLLFLAELRLALSVPILWNSLTTKHPAYRNEQETRLILLNDIRRLETVIKTRTRGSQIVSYVPISFPADRKNIIRKVMIGPAAIGDAESGVENLLRAKGLYDKGRVSKSRIPYRPR